MKAITVRVGSLEYTRDLTFEVEYDQVGAIFTGAAGAGIAWLDCRSEGVIFLMLASGYYVRTRAPLRFQRAYGARCTLWVRRRP